jgi:hypothetical protein
MIHLLVERSSGWAFVTERNVISLNLSSLIWRVGIITALPQKVVVKIE